MQMQIEEFISATVCHLGVFSFLALGSKLNKQHRFSD